MDYTQQDGRMRKFPLSKYICRICMKVNIYETIYVKIYMKLKNIYEIYVKLKYLWNIYGTKMYMKKYGTKIFLKHMN